MRVMHGVVINGLALVHAAVEGFIISALVNVALRACSAQHATGYTADGSARAHIAGMALARHRTNNATQNCTANDPTDDSAWIALAVGHAACIVVTIGVATITLGISRRRGQHQAGQTANDDQ